MQFPSTPENEVARLEALQDLQVLDSSPELAFDALVHAASVVCDVPISLISLIDRDRQWFKASIGLPGVTETPREMAFCAHAIHEDSLFEVSDATSDVRFADNPLVVGHPNIKFYTGAPIVLSDGSRAGTLCVIDRKPRHLDDRQREVLRCLAVAAAYALEGRSAILKVQKINRDLADKEDRLRNLYDCTPAMMHSIDALGRLISVSNAWLVKMGYERSEVIGRPSSEFLTAPSREHAVKTVLPAFF